jgi:hypothetical protein
MPRVPQKDAARRVLRRIIVRPILEQPAYYFLAAAMNVAGDERFRRIPAFTSVSAALRVQTEFNRLARGLGKIILAAKRRVLISSSAIITSSSRNASRLLQPANGGVATF